MQESRDQATQPWPGHSGDGSSKDKIKVDTKKRKTDVDDNLSMTRVTEISGREKTLLPIAVQYVV